jgi:hypothetical protein
MAKQAGPLYLLGTIDDITFYKMEGQYFARKKSSLNKKRFRTDPHFKRSRVAAGRFGEASKLASTIYWQLPKEARGKGVVNRITGQVGRLLKEGKSKEEVILHVQQLYGIAAILSTTPPLTEPATPVLSHLSKWKVIPNGKLVIASPGRYQSAKLIHKCSSLAILNSYKVPWLFMQSYLCKQQL